MATVKPKAEAVRFNHGRLNPRRGNTGPSRRDATIAKPSDNQIVLNNAMITKGGVMVVGNVGGVPVPKLPNPNVL